MLFTTMYSKKGLMVPSSFLADKLPQLHLYRAYQRSLDLKIIIKTGPESFLGRHKKTTAFLKQDTLGICIHTSWAAWDNVNFCWKTFEFALNEYESLKPHLSRFIPFKRQCFFIQVYITLVALRGALTWCLHNTKLFKNVWFSYR